MSAILGWFALAASLMISALCVFYNILFVDNIIPMIEKVVWGTFGDGGGVTALQQAPSIGYNLQWGRFIIPIVAIILGVVIWYYEVIVWGRSDNQQ